MRIEIGKTGKIIYHIITAVLISVMLHGEVFSQDKDFRLGPRDIITLTIFAGGEKQQELNLTVSGQGMINVPFIGPLKAAGFTTQQLEDLIAKPLARDYFVDPEVNIQIKEYHSLRYYISGAVRSPGLYEMSSKSSLMEVIAKAGGVLPERGNVAYILREATDKMTDGNNIEDLMAKNEPIRVDLKKLLDMGDMSHNPMLVSGDVIYIPLEKTLNLAESKIYVEGEVKNPGVFDFQPGLTALNACIMAGGFDKYAAPNRTRIIRQTGDSQEIIKLDLNDVKEGNIPDMQLKPGDRIHVPESWL